MSSHFATAYDFPYSGAPDIRGRKVVDAPGLEPAIARDHK